MPASKRETAMNGHCRFSPFIECAVSYQMGSPIVRIRQPQWRVTAAERERFRGDAVNSSFKLPVTMQQSHLHFWDLYSSLIVEGTTFVLDILGGIPEARSLFQLRGVVNRVFRGATLNKSVRRNTVVILPLTFGSSTSFAIWW